jgi:predicted negative regulator of RcsB-dependent stress response
MIRQQIIIVVVIIAIALWIGFRKWERTNDDDENQVE